MSCRITPIMLILVIAGAGLGAGCGGRTIGGGPAGSPDAAPPGSDGAIHCVDYRDCNPGVTCGDLVQCVDGVCRPDYPRHTVPCEECVVDGDCVVAVPVNCCLGCRRVMSREQLAQEDCLYEQGLPPGYLPEHCHIECLVCLPCFPQPLDAACEAFQCVPRGEGCPDPGGEQLPVATTLAITADPQAYTGLDFRVTGNVLPGLGMCDDNCPAESCCTHDILIDGLVLLRGVPCGLDLTWWSDDYCADELDHGWHGTGLKPGRRYEFTGTVNMAGGVPWDPPTLRVDGIRVLEPEGLGGAYELTVTEVISDAGDPICTPPQWEVGDDARLYVGHSEGTVRIAAPYFSCEWTDTFWGTSQSGTNFDTWVPIECDGCCCDYHLTGEVSGDTITGQYESYDGTCRYTVRFEGTRRQG